MARQRIATVGPSVAAAALVVALATTAATVAGATGTLDATTPADRASGPAGIAAQNGTDAQNATDDENDTDGQNGTDAQNATEAQNDTDDGGDATLPPIVAPSVVEDIAGQVAIEDGTVAVMGTARGQDEVLVVLIDRRGRIASTILVVDDDDVFEDDDVPLVTARGEELSEGPIIATVFGVGRDGVVGDGEIAGITRADVEDLDEQTRQRVRAALVNRSVVRTQRQVLQLFYEESIDEAGSDDLVLVDAFRYTDGRTTIEAVVPAAGVNSTGGETNAAGGQSNATDGQSNATDGQSNATGIRPITVGETMVVSGVTNRKPDDNTIAVEAIEGPTPELLPIVSTDEWGQDGVWTVEIDTDGVEPGTYTIEVDDGDSTDRVEVELLPAEDDSTGDETDAGRLRDEGGFDGY